MSWQYPQMDLHDAVCLVTGASTGIGRASAIALAEHGAHVRAGSRTPASLVGAHPLIEPILLDVRDPESCRSAIGAGVDVLVNNAGYGVEGTIEEIGDDDLLEQYEVNVFAVWRLCRLALPGMRAAGGGAIVNVSSFGGQAPFPNIGAYRSSKFAVEGLTWTLHLETARLGVRVASVQPGLTASEFDGNMRRGRAFQEHGPYSELRRSAAATYPRMSPVALDPADVASAMVAWLLAESGPLHLRVGEDAERVIAAICSGDEDYERFLVHDLGFDWHPLRGAT